MLAPASTRIIGCVVMSSRASRIGHLCSSHARGSTRVPRIPREWSRDSICSGVLRANQVDATLQTDLDTRGGYLTAPEEFVAGLFGDLDNAVAMRRLATVYTTQAQSLGIRPPHRSRQRFQLGSRTRNSGLRYVAPVREASPDAALPDGRIKCPAI